MTVVYTLPCGCAWAWWPGAGLYVSRESVCRDWHLHFSRDAAAWHARPVGLAR